MDMASRGLGNTRYGFKLKDHLPGTTGVSRLPSGVSVAASLAHTAALFYMTKGKGENN